MEDKKTPKHLEGLEKILNQQFVRQPDGDNYAEIAFTLIEAEGDKESIKAVADYIQRSHKTIKDRAAAHAKMINNGEGEDRNGAQSSAGYTADMAPRCW